MLLKCLGKLALNIEKYPPENSVDTQIRDKQKR